MKRIGLAGYSCASAGPAPASAAMKPATAFAVKTLTSFPAFSRSCSMLYVAALLRRASALEIPRCETMDLRNARVRAKLDILEGRGAEGDPSCTGCRGLLR